MSLFYSLRSWIVVPSLAVIYLLSATSTAANERFHELDVGACWAAVELELNSTHEVFADSQGNRDVFQVEIASPGMLLLEASDAYQGSLRPKIELVSSNCASPRAADVTYVERSLARPIIRINAPGTYQFAITTAAGDSATSYRLDIGFSKAIRIHPQQWATKDVEEWEDDDEPLGPGLPSAESLSLSALVNKDVEEWEDDDEPFGTELPTKEVEEWEDDNEPFGTGGDTCGNLARTSGVAQWTFDAPGILAAVADDNTLVALLQPTGSFPGSTLALGVPLGPSRELLSWIEPGSYSLRWALSEASPSSCEPRFFFYPICGLANADDHADTRACATALEIGTEVAGEMRHESTTDVDWFSFVLTSHANVRLESSGDIDLLASLLDTSGRQLATDDDGGVGWSFRFDTELCPGRYFVKVEGAETAAGRYVLVTSTNPS